MQAEAIVNERRKGRRMLLGLVIFFLLPIALVLALHLSGWRPGGSSHGELLKPPQPLQMPGVHLLDGQAFASERWHGKWSLLYVVEGPCGDSCRQQVHLLRQVHATLGKDIERAQRVLLVAHPAAPGSLRPLQDRYPDLIVLLADVPPRLAGGVFLVDPLGNLVLHYPPDFDPQGLRKDMQRLLRYSWVG